MAGQMDEAKGRAKQAYGELTGDEDIEREGEIDEVAGKAQGKAEDVVDRAKGAAGDFMDKIDRER